MGQEIERKFLLNTYPEFDLFTYNLRTIEQTYLSVSNNSELRIRKEVYKVGSDEYTLTFKSGNGLIRGESEINIDKNTYSELIKKSTSLPITKVRREFNFNDFAGSIDVYEGKLSGLIVVEVEFETENEADEFIAPEWFGSEVTEDKTYKNKNLWKSIQSK